MDPCSCYIVIYLDNIDCILYGLDIYIYIYIIS